MIKKSNIDYVREYIETHGPITLKNETLEFLSAAEEEISSLKEEVSNGEDRENVLNQECDEKDSRITELEEQEDNFHTVDCGIGTIEWRVNSMQLQTAMEEYTSRIASSYIQNKVTLF